MYDKRYPMKFAKWAAVERDYLREHYGSRAFWKIAEALKRTPASIRVKACELGLTSVTAPGSPRKKKPRFRMPTLAQLRPGVQVVHLKSLNRYEMLEAPSSLDPQDLVKVRRVWCARVPNARARADRVSPNLLVLVYDYERCYAEFYGKKAA